MFLKTKNCWDEKQAVGSTPLYLMMQKRQETEVTKLSQNNLFFFTVYAIFVFKPQQLRLQ